MASQERPVAEQVATREQLLASITDNVNSIKVLGIQPRKNIPSFDGKGISFSIHNGWGAPASSEVIHYLISGESVINPGTTDTLVITPSSSESVLNFHPNLKTDAWRNQGWNRSDFPPLFSLCVDPDKAEIDKSGIQDEKLLRRYLQEINGWLEIVISVYKEQSPL